MAEKAKDDRLNLGIMYRVLGLLPVGLKCDWIEASKYWILVIHKPEKVEE